MVSCIINFTVLYQAVTELPKKFVSINTSMQLFHSGTADVGISRHLPPKYDKYK